MRRFLIAVTTVTAVFAASAASGLAAPNGNADCNAQLTVALISSSDPGTNGQLASFFAKELQPLGQVAKLITQLPSDGCFP